MRIYSSCNPKSRTNLGRISNKNRLGKKLVRPMYKFAKSVIETSRKMGKAKTYNKTFNNSIPGNRWREAVDEEL